MQIIIIKILHRVLFYINKYKSIIIFKLYKITKSYNFYLIKYFYKETFFNFIPILYPTFLPDINKKRFGKIGDGGYVIPVEFCNEKNILLSFGINNDVSFENQVLNETSLTSIYCFDPSIVCLPTNSNPNLKFFKQGISNFPPNNNYLTLNNIFNSVVSEKDYDLINIKMDIESYEWDIINSLDISIIKKIGFLTLEFHLIDTNNFIKELFLPFLVRKRLNILKKLMNEFYLIHLHANNHNYFHYINFSFPVLIEITLIPKYRYKDLLTKELSFYNLPNDVKKEDIQFPFHK
jgi:hypothetical protein